MTTEQTRPGQLVSEINTWTTSEGGKGGNGLRAMCVQMCITTDVVVIVVVVEVSVSECTTTDGGNVALSRTCVCAQTLTFVSELALLPCHNTYVCSQRCWPSDKQIEIIRCSLFSEEVWFGKRLGKWETMGQVKIG